MASYDTGSPKFQAATSPRQSTGVALWLAVGGVGLMVGEATYQVALASRGSGVTGPVWLWLFAAAALALGMAAVCWRSETRSGRPLGFGLVVLAVLLAIATWRNWQVRVDPRGAAVEATAAAIRSRDRFLASAVAGASHTARIALQRTQDVQPGSAPPLGDLLEGGPVEIGLVVLAGDTVVTVAGPQRVAPLADSVPAALVRTPFARVLVVTERSRHRVAQAALLLDAEAALPAPGATLAGRSGRWQQVAWRWLDTLSRQPFPSVETATAHIAAVMQPIVPPSGDLVVREAQLARWLAVAGLAVLAVVVIASGAPALARAAALLIPVWVLVRAGTVAETYGGAAAWALVAATALTLLAVILWQRPLRRQPIGLVAAVILLAMAPPLVARAALDIAPPMESGSMLSAFLWQAVLALATAAYLAVASAPLRSAEDVTASWRWGALATLAAVVVGALGIEAWRPANPGGPVTGLTMQWAPWYLPLLLLALIPMLPITSLRSRRLAIATTAAVLAALASWGASLEQRQALARQDLDRLGATGDAEATQALQQFGDAAVADGATTIDRLYATWRASPLAAVRAPIQMALWRDTTVTEYIALDSLSPSWGDLQRVVAADAGTRRVVSLPRDPGHHQVLVLPIRGDTLATVLIGPRSRLVHPTRFGRLVGWRIPADAAYTLATVSPGAARADFTFRRTGRHVRADRLVTAGGRPLVVRATVSMSPPLPFAIRAGLTVLLDVVLALAAWWLLERILGFVRTTGREMFRRSYRRTVTAALISFFVVPAAFFTLWSALRLRQEVGRDRGEEVARALRDIEGDAAFDPELLDAPQPAALAQVADRADAELAVYRRGRLVAASTPLLAELGLLAPVIDPSLARSDPSDGRHLASPVPGANVRIGAEATDVPATLVAAALPGGGAELARDQVDLALLLLLASLGGTLAAVAVAGAVARALAQPIEILRRRALAIGRREPGPALREPPLEFEPVFTAIAQMERDLQQSESRLEEETARTARIVAWGEMARQVAHEIKNPLTPMRLGLQHLRRLGADRRPDLADQTAATADRLLEEIERLDRIARSFARYGTPPDRDAGPLDQIDLDAVCGEIVKLFALAGAEPRLTVEGRATGPVRARREELMQVLLNLLDNARHAGADRVRLVLEEHRLVVEDDGRGIPEDQLERIFEPTFSTTTSGTGLGLAIVRRLVDGWGAEIVVDSVEGEGTAFTIAFAPAGSTPATDGT